MPEDVITKTCAHCGKDFNWEWIGYKVEGQYYCGRSECEATMEKKPRNKSRK